MMERKKPCVLVIVEAYEPAFKAGGPVRSIKNIVSWLSGDLDIYIYTRDRDLGDSGPFPNLQLDSWIDRDGARVWYAQPDTFSTGIMKAVNRLRPDVVYINSLFAASSWLIWVLNAVGFPLANKVVLAPRGEVQHGALRQKRLKKIVALAALRLARATKGIWFHATSSDEMIQLRKIFGGDNGIYLVPNLTARLASIAPSRTKTAGELSLVYLSRITPKKNLLFLIEVVAKLLGVVSVEIIGPVDDAVYWDRVLDRARILPPNVTFRYAGDIPHSQVTSSLQQHHLFVLPTLSENYGHAIVEAWSAGLPVVISNRTPWRRLHEKDVGWDLELDLREWKRVLQKCVDMQPNEFSRLQVAARRHAGGIMSAPPLAECLQMLSEPTSTTIL